MHWSFKKRPLRKGFRKDSLKKGMDNIDIILDTALLVLIMRYISKTNHFHSIYYSNFES